ncbi:MAG TPA: hypothetical protein VGV14_01475 [Rhodanobacter sp.]|nr:hypothetical protein [Rhodanobacter sp.]
MSLVFTIKEAADGLWCISLGQSVLFAQLHLASAIKQARHLAREKHAATGQSVRVEMTSPDFMILLAQYARPGTELNTAAA